MKKLRILVADAHTYVRHALQVALPQMNGVAVEVVNEVLVIDELPARVDRLQPDLLLLDWQFPQLAQTHLIDVQHRCPHIRIIALSIHAEERDAALSAGVDAFVNKGDGAEHLIEAIRKLIEGR
ncbi:MAG: response regulator transcription factor [Chloroflexi bacterium]|nr:response regulator transcription factor [Chloroflexota bacterium]